MQSEIKKKGATIEAVNGNGFTVISENPTMKSYNTTVNRFTTATKQLFDLLPKDLPDIIPVQQSDETSKPRDKLSAFHEKYRK